MDTHTPQDSSRILQNLLDGISDPSQVKARISSLSPEEKKLLVDVGRLEGAKRGNTRDYIEYVFADQLDDGGGFLPEHILELLDWINQICEMPKTKRKGGALEPRGSSKSTSVTLGWLSQYIAEHRDVRVGLMSNTDDQAEAFSAALMATVEQNERFREIYGDLVGSKKWTLQQWTIKGSKWEKSKDRTVFARGVGGSIISKRFDIILCDDILDKDNTATPDQMRKVREWFWQTVYPCLVPGGIIIIIGTRWADGDFYEELMKPLKLGGREWPFLVKSAEWTDEQGQRHSFWPERFSLSDLDAMVVDMGKAMYACAMMNDVRGLTSGNVFPPIPEDINNSFWFDELPPGHYTIRMGVDFAFSLKTTADYTARVLTAEDEKGEFWVLAAYHDRRESRHPEFVNDGFLAYPKTSLITIENNQAQAAIVRETMRLYPHLPIVSRRTDADKKTRARPLAAKYEAHKMHWHISLKDTDFHIEHRTFDGERGHDDFIDAEGLSVDLTGGGFFFGTMSRTSLKMAREMASA